MQVRALCMLFLGLGAACTKAQTDAGAAVTLPAASAALRASSSASVAPPTIPSAALSLFRGALLDEKALTSTALATGDVIANALGARTAYVTVGRAPPRELRAFSTANASASWAVATQGCGVMVAAPGGVYCDDPSGIRFYDEKTGTPTNVSPKADVSHLLVVGGHLLALRNDHTLESFDVATGASLKTLTLPQRTPYFVASGALACGVIFELGVVAYCVDANLDFVWKKPVTLPYAMLHQIDANFIVLATYNAPTEHAIVLRTSDGAVLYDGPEHVSAAVPRADRSLEGFLVTTPSTRFLSPAGALVWASPEKLESGASAIALDGAIVVATFHPIATGASLLAFDRTSGAKLWTGALEMLPIAHSKYSNQVTVSLASGHVRVAGLESSQEYVQLFDPSNGKRLLSLISRR